MWNRKDLKAQGKAAMKRNYWKSILVGIVDALAVGGAAAGLRSNGNVDTTWQQVTTETSAATMAAFVVAVFGALIVILLVELAVNALLIGPLRVGCSHFKLSALRGIGNISELGSGFDSNYKRNAKTMFLSSLYIGLWSILFVIPGIIKTYEYRMVPYILAENPDLSAKEVLEKSKEMMNGNKWNAFVLDLSFILWDILSAVTFNLVGLFYVQPYRSMTDAALYETVKHS